ncbi:MAG: hypothetical protein LUC83_01275 [Clostridiales bacterium]|nr:hypothetical protein [Clostridiales bacterium]
MKIKNVSKKIIGNGAFRLLPGETMEVNGKELWVKRYMDTGKLEKVEEPVSNAVKETAEAAETEAATETAETEAATVDATAETTTKKKTRASAKASE